MFPTSATRSLGFSVHFPVQPTLGGHVGHVLVLHILSNSLEKQQKKYTSFKDSLSKLRTNNL